ncbi:molybdenum cofactor biosynthesis protein MoaE [Salana multivorans]
MSGVDLRHARVTTDVLDVAEHLAAVDDDRCGAVSVFVGRIRNHDPGIEGEVAGIEYSAHPDAERVLSEIAVGLDDVAGAPTIVAVSHRVGSLEVGDVALVACVATAHRAQAQELSQRLVERIKHELPVWKKQHTVDGAHHWVGL